ncbi:MAG: histidine kinase [Acidobacteriota bacterium]
MPGRLWTWLGLWATGSALLFAYRHLAVLAEGGRRPFLKPLVEEPVAVAGAMLLFFPLQRFVRRFPLARGHRLRRLPLYAGALAVYSLLHTSMNWGGREVVYRLVGLGDYDYGIMPLRYAMEFPIDVLSFVLMVGAIHGFDRLRRARERELDRVRLEGSLARAQVQNLRLQLQPHFLFNALNTISATMYQDPAAADEMIDRLAGLLRASLRTVQSDEVPLEEELRVLDAYLAIQRARFGDRIQVRIDVPEDTLEALVPSMVLQPLVENAIRHGSAETEGRGRIAVRARRRGDRLELEVEDDGPGAPPGRDPLGSGLGLSATAERMQLLYGDDHRFEAGNRPEGGFRVAAALPLSRSGDAHPASEAPG